MLDMSSFASVAFITALSVDRYMVITHPFSYTQEKVQRFFKISMVLLWVILGLAFISCAIIFYNRDWLEGIYCVIQVKGTTTLRFWFAVLLIPALGIPMLLVCTIYARLLILGRKHALRIRQQNPDPQPNNAAGSGRRGYKTFAAVTLCFALTSLPYMASVIHVQFILSDDMRGSSPALTILTVCKFIFNSHGWLNALVYVFMNRCFRQEAKKVLKGARRCMCRQQDHPEQ
ncbi:G-protein coupled receptor 52-like [Patiria miniata]|uniref:G-protein coupled receptors family 1 profile domain-containing protein n=1 Tax=Patiria miniata TaxID=46514 RepID=A0A913Z6J4_PATMI|nr:G-protein coupled receptor 52-like [Patiria miniata]